jgi:hypothetical protein
MKTTRDNLTNNQIFALRQRANEAENRRLVRTIDRYLQERGEADLQLILNAINDEDRPSVVVMHCAKAGWRAIPLFVADDVDKIRGWNPDHVIYIRGIYSVEKIRHLPMIESLLRAVLEPMRVDGARVEWYVDGPS